MAKSNRPKKRQNNDRAKGKQQDIKRRDFFDVLTLLIALFGAISGGYATYKEFKKPSQIGFHINFNKENSAFAIIASNSESTNNKAAIMMYNLVFAGYGSIPSTQKT